VRTSVAAGAIAALVLFFGADRAHAQAPWESAEELRTSLFDAQSGLLLDQGDAGAEVQRARASLAGELERGLRARAPQSLRALAAALDAAETAATRGDERALAAARGTALAALRSGAYTVTVRATRDGDVAQARRWLLIREFRKATRFTRPGVDATASLDALAAGEIEPGEAALGVRKDLLDAYQARLVSYLDDALQASDREFRPALAESAALAAGYWPILAPKYERQRGRAARDRLERTFGALARRPQPGTHATSKPSGDAFLRGSMASRRRPSRRRSRHAARSS
jgi:high-affinity iron transporter